MNIFCNMDNTQADIPNNYIIWYFTLYISHSFIFNCLIVLLLEQRTRFLPSAIGLYDRALLFHSVSLKFRHFNFLHFIVVPSFHFCLVFMNWWKYLDILAINFIPATNSDLVQATFLLAKYLTIMAKYFSQWN